MAVFRGKAGGVGMFLGTLPAYGADPGNSTHNIFCYDATSAEQADIYFDNTAGNGQEEPVGGTIMRRTTGLSISGPVSDTAYHGLTGLAIGSDARSTVSSGYQYAQTLVGQTAELPNTAICVSPANSADSSDPYTMQHLGCVVDSHTISGSAQSGIWEFSTNFATAGSVGSPNSIANATNKPNLPQFMFERSYLFSGADGGMAISGGAPATIEQPTSTSAPTGTSIATPSNFSPYLKAFSWTINNNLDRSIGHATGSDTYAYVMPRTQRTQSVSMSFVWDSSNTTILGLRSTIGVVRCFDLMVFSTTLAATGCYYGFSLKFPRLVLESATIGGGLGIKTIDTVWRPVGTINTTNPTVSSYSYGVASGSTASGFIN